MADSLPRDAYRSAGISQRPPPPAESYVRSVIDRRAWFLSVAAVLFCLGALLLVPALFERRARAIRTEIAEVALPAHDRVDEIELALALEVAEVRGYLVTGRQEHRREARQARGAVLRAINDLGSMAGALGPAVVSRLHELRRVEAGNAAAMSQLLDQTPPSTDPSGFLVEQQAVLTQVFGATGRLADVIEQAADERRQRRMEAVRRQELVVTMLLVLLALVSVLAVLWLGRSP